MSNLKVLLAGLAFSVIYVFLFPQTTSMELILQPVAVNSNNELPKNQNKKILNLDGENRDYLSPITIWDKKKNRSLVGLLDGRLFVHDESGNIIFDYMSVGSRVKAVYGGTLSDDGMQIALITGLDPQRLLLLQESSGKYHLKYQHRLDSDFRRPVFMKFISDNRYVVFEDKSGTIALDGEKGLIQRLGTGNLISVMELSTSKIILLLSGYMRNGAHLSILSQFFPGNYPVLTTIIPKEIQSVYVEDEQIYLVSRNHNAIIKVSVQ